jgi:hypothetical protein
MMTSLRRFILLIAILLIALGIGNILFGYFRGVEYREVLAQMDGARNRHDSIEQIRVRYDFYKFVVLGGKWMLVLAGFLLLVFLVTKRRSTLLSDGAVTSPEKQLPKSLLLFFILSALCSGNTSYAQVWRCGELYTTVEPSNQANSSCVLLPEKVSKNAQGGRIFPGNVPIITQPKLREDSKPQKNTPMHGTIFTTNDPKKLQAPQSSTSDSQSSPFGGGNAGSLPGGATTSDVKKLVEGALKDAPTLFERE